MLVRCSLRVCSQKMNSLIKKISSNSSDLKTLMSSCHFACYLMQLFRLLSRSCWFPTICWIFLSIYKLLSTPLPTFQIVIDIEFYLLIIHSQNYSSLVDICQCSFGFRKWSSQDNWYIIVRSIV